jgi:hypothetical protein
VQRYHGSVAKAPPSKRKELRFHGSALLRLGFVGPGPRGVFRRDERNDMPHDTRGVCRKPVLDTLFKLSVPVDF